MELSVTIVPFILLWTVMSIVSQRSYWACLIIAIHNAMHFLRVTNAGAHGTVAWGYSFNFGSIPSVVAIIAPLAVFGIYRVWSLRSEKENNDSGPTFC